jgi:hypothetical protein
MVRYYFYGLKIIKILVYVWILFLFFSVFHIDQVMTTSEGDLVIIAFFEGVRNILTYAFFGIIYLIAIAFIQLTSFMFFINPDFMFNFLDQLIRNFVRLWFTFPNGNVPLLTEIPDLIMAEISVFTGDLYLFSFQILIIVSVIYLIRSFLQNNPKYDMIAIGSLIAMIVVPLMVFGFRNMMDLLYIPHAYLDNIPNPLDPAFSYIPIDDFFQFLASPVILLAIISYVYLELSFQINYTYTVTKPSLQRSDRLEAQLGILESESHFVVANIDKIREEAKKRKEELQIEEKTSVNKFLLKLEERFSYVKEMIEKRKLEEEEKKLVTAASKTRRLGKYIERLFREDPEARDTLTARSSTPKAKVLALSTIVNFISRLVILILISFVIIHPHWFFVYVFNMPPAISESVAMYSPEVVIILLIPIMLVFPVISKIISYIKHRSLIIRLQQEGRIKEILASVGDYVKKDEPLEQEITVETQTMET